MTPHRYPCAGAWPTKPGSATLPFFGVNPVLLNEKGEELPGVAEGILALKGSWPSQFRDLWGNHQRYEETYFSPFKVWHGTLQSATERSEEVERRCRLGPGIIALYVTGGSKHIKNLLIIFTFAELTCADQS